MNYKFCVKCNISKITGISFYKTNNTYSNICVPCDPKKKPWRPYYVKSGKYRYLKQKPKIKAFNAYPHRLRVLIKQDVKDKLKISVIFRKYRDEYKFLKYQNLLNHIRIYGFNNIVL